MEEEKIPKTNRKKYILDYIPLLILAFYATRLIVTLSQTGIRIEWINISGFIFFFLAVMLFTWRHQAGVLALGLMLFLGLFGAVSLNPGISSFGFGFGKSEDSWLRLYGDPMYFVFLILHFILSGRYYVGILTRKYWDDFLLSCWHDKQ